MRLSSIYLGCLFICVVSAQSLSDPNWRLAWNDEFNGDSVDTTKWNVRNRPGNYGNGELQWYYPNTSTTSNGSLVISATNVAFGGESYMSGWLDSMDKAMFTLGRYEIRAKMPAGKGLWPALWILSQSKCWALGSELDIAEFRGSYPTRMGQYYHYATQCCAIYGSCISSTGSEYTSSPSVDYTAGYHIYTVTWNTTTVCWYIDNVLKNSFLVKKLTTTGDVSPHYWIINFAVGGSYPGSPDSTNVWPAKFSVDYVRNYVYRTTCSGEKCSGNGCCNSTSLLCICNSGWSGASCEQWVGNFSTSFNALTNMDNVPNGWGNPQTLYLTANSAIVKSGSDYALKLTLTKAGCPSGCGGLTYSSGAWESIPRYTYGNFSFQAMGPTIAGTGFSLGAAGEAAALEQFAFVFSGGSRTQVALWTWTVGWAYQQATINLSFDHSAAYHIYQVNWGPDFMRWYIDGKQVFNNTVVIPNAPRLGPGAYYSAESDWYGGAVAYTAPVSVSLTQFTWVQNLTYTAKC